MYRINNVALLVTFIVTHMLSVGLVLYRHCKGQNVSYRQMLSCR